ncbi:MAG TPA: SDR family oxidoreductase [Patescibacteria group bacterium]
MLNNLKKILSNNSVSDDFLEDLRGKVIIITGAGKGIGRVLSRTLNKYGASLALISRDPNSLKITSDLLSKEFPVLVYSGDITLESDVKNFISKTIKAFGRIDVLINNAGVFLEKPLDKVAVKDFYHIFDTNFFGLFLMCKLVIPYMKKQNDGFILNIGSKISHNTSVSPHKVLYATTKYAVEGFSLALNNELKANNIRVNCLMPGTVNTFASLRSNQYLSPQTVAEIISLMIRFKSVDFENIVIKSIRQNL